MTILGPPEKFWLSDSNALIPRLTENKPANRQV